MASKGKQTHDGSSPVEAPVPLVTLDNSGKFVVGTEAINLLRQIKGEIAVVAIAGIYRTGKSYILNRLHGRQQGFAVGPTVNPCTKGIYIWGAPIVMSRPNDDPINIILVDTEGIGSIQQDQTYDAKIFSLAILLSSYFVYNSLSIIDERALDGLSLVVNLTKQISVKSNAGGASGSKKTGRNSFGPKGASAASSSNGSSNGSAAAGRNSKGGASSSSSGSASNAAELADYFPSFLWLLRDFALDLVDERGAEITSRQYLENALRERPEAAQQSKNAIRSSIKQLFRDRDCCTLVRPVVDEKQLKTIDSIPYGQLRPEFRAQSEELVAKILDEAPVKTINGQALSGDSFVQLLNIYTDAINSGAVASIQNAWESVSSSVNQQAMEEAFHVWTSGISARYNPNRPLGDEQLQALHIECMNEAFGMFDSMSYQSAQTAAIRKTLKQKMVADYSRLIQANREASSRFVSRLLNTLYEPLEAKAKSGQIKSMEALLDAWAVLRKNYFDQLGDAQASRLVAYDEFIKFFSTNVVHTSAHVMRTVQEAHGSKLEEVKKLLESAKNEKHALEVSSVKAIEEAKRLKEGYLVAQKRVVDLEKENAHQFEMVSSAQKQAQSTQSELTKANAEINKAHAEARVYMAASQASESKILEVKEKLAAALEAKLRAHADHKVAIAGLEKTIAALEAQVSSSETSSDKAKRSLQLQVDKSARDVTTLKAQVESLNAQIDTLKAEKEAREAKTSSEAKAAVASASAKAAKAIEAADSSNKTLQAHNDALLKQVDTLKAQLDRSSKTRDQASKDLEKATRDFDKLKGHQITLERRNEQLEKTLETAERDRLRSAKEIDLARTAQSVAESAQEQTSADLQEALEQSQMEIETLAARCEDLEAELSQALELADQVVSTPASRRSSIGPAAGATYSKATSSSAPKATSSRAVSTKATSSAPAKASTASTPAKATKKTAPVAKASGRKSVASAAPAPAPAVLEYDSDSSLEDFHGRRYDDDAMSVDVADERRQVDFFPDDVGSEFDDDMDAYLAAREDLATSSTPIAAKRTAKKAAKATTSSRASRLPEAAPSASPATKRTSSKTTAAKRTTGAPVIDDSDEESLMSSSEEEVAAPAPKSARTPAKRGSKSTAAAAKRTSMVATPSKAAPAAKAASSAMEVDFDLPEPSSRKRGRNFTENEDFANAELGTPHKRSQNDPTQMDKAALKAHLTASGVKLPPDDRSKAFYMELFNKKFGRKR